MKRKTPQNSVDHSHHRQRLLQTVLNLGLENSNKFIALEFILTYVLPRVDVNPIAHRLLEKFGCISAVLSATPEQLMEVQGIGKTSALRLSLFPQILMLYQQDKLKNETSLKTKEQIIAYCRAYLIGKAYENLYAICLNSNAKVLSVQLLARGTTNQVTINRLDFIRKIATTNELHSVVLCHSHPNNLCKPSKEDYAAHDKMKEILTTCGIELAEHIIVCDKSCYLMEEEVEYVF